MTSNTWWYIPTYLMETNDDWIYNDTWRLTLDNQCEDIDNDTSSWHQTQLTEQCAADTDHRWQWHAQQTLDTVDNDKPHWHYSELTQLTTWWQVSWSWPTQMTPNVNDMPTLTVDARQLTMSWLYDLIGLFRLINRYSERAIWLELNAITKALRGSAGIQPTATSRNHINHPFTRQCFRRHLPVRTGPTWRTRHDWFVYGY